MTSTPRQRALESAENGRLVVASLHDAILAELPDDFETLTVQAHRIAQCNSDSNIWLGTDLHNEQGECFDGGGRLWTCGSKLCSFCLAKATRRNRKRLKQIVQAQRLTVGENFNFITLTMPNLGIDILEARSLMNYAWTLFRKKQWFKRTFIGAVKSEEFTLTKRGYHYHSHIIGRTKYVNYHSLRHYWTEALTTAFERSGRTLSVATSDHMAVANCKRIGSVDEACNEVAKYITKTTTWKKMQSHDLLNLLRIRRWPRMFEFIGSFRSSSCGVVGEESENSLNKTILDTQCISDGESDPRWKRKLRMLGAEQYLQILHRDISDQSQVRMQQLKFHYSAAKLRLVKSPRSNDIPQTLQRIENIRKRREELSNGPERWYWIAKGSIQRFGGSFGRPPPSAIPCDSNPTFPNNVRDDVHQS